MRRRRGGRAAEGSPAGRVQRRRGRPTRSSERRHDIADVDVDHETDFIVGSVGDHLQLAVGPQVRVLALDRAVSEGLLLGLLVKGRCVLDLPRHSVGRIRVSIIWRVEDGGQ